VARARQLAGTIQETVRDNGGMVDQQLVRRHGEGAAGHECSDDVHAPCEDTQPNTM